MFSIHGTFTGRRTTWNWSQLSDLNRRPSDYKSGALPTELNWHHRQHSGRMRGNTLPVFVVQASYFPPCSEKELLVIAASFSDWQEVSHKEGRIMARGAYALTSFTIASPSGGEEASRSISMADGNGCNRCSRSLQAHYSG